MKNKKYNWLMALFCLLAGVGQAQTPRAKGLVFDARQYRANVQKRAIDDKRGRTTPITVSLRPFCPTPQDQGLEPSCTAWALTYGAMTIQYALVKKVQLPHEVNKIACSKSFVFNALAQDDPEAPLPIESVTDFLRQNGTCLAATFRNELPTSRLPDQLARREALDFRLLNAVEAYDPDERIPAARQIRRLKRMLADSLPLVVGLRLPYSFANLSTAVFMPAPDDPVDSSAHAMCLIGYDDVDSTFELMNSWGTEWGDRGFVRIHYRDFLPMLCCAYRLMPRFVLPTAVVQPKVSIVLRKPVGYDAQKQPQFEEIRVQLDTVAQRYRIAPPNVWKVGMGFQAALRDVPRGWWVQVATVNTAGEVALLYESQISNPIIDLPIPEEGMQIELEEPGTEWLVLACGPQREPALLERVTAMKTSALWRNAGMGLLPHRMGLVSPQGGILVLEMTVAE